MMTHDDYYQIIPDFVLGLLSPNQQGAFERHIAHCPTCREAIIQEREFIKLARVSIHQATNFDKHRLRELMPARPPKNEPGVIYHRRQMQMAPFLLVFALILGTIFLRMPSSPTNFPALSITTNSSTATMTHTPTATLSQSPIASGPSEFESTGSGYQNQLPVSIMQSPDPVSSSVTPQPSATP